MTGVTVPQGYVMVNTQPKCICDNSHGEIQEVQKEGHKRASSCYVRSSGLYQGSCTCLTKRSRCESRSVIAWSYCRDMASVIFRKSF